MKFSLISAACLVGSVVVAAPTPQFGGGNNNNLPNPFGGNNNNQRGSAITSAVQRVTDSFQRLDGFMNTRIPTDRQQRTTYFQNALNANSAVTRDFQMGATEILRANNIGATDQLAISRETNPLLTAVNRCMKHWTDMKRQAQDIGASNAVLDSLLQMQVAAGGFYDSLERRIPAMTVFINTSVKRQVTTAIDRAVAEYRRR